MGERLAGKVAIITGSATGIGKQGAILFAKEGARIVVADLDEKGGHQTVDEIQAGGGTAAFVRTNVSDPAQVDNLVKTAKATYGRIDILYNNAAVNLYGKLTDTSEQDWDRVMSVNVKSVFLCCKAVIPVMRETGGGAIVNTASTAAIVGLRNLAVYTASKGAVLQLTKNLALDYAADHIRVNALCPGVTATEMTLKMIETSADPAATRARYDHGRPLNRMASPIEMARAALFLASDESSFMTGAPLIVDGGYVAE